MSPYDSPAPYNLLQYTEIAEGIWYPKGGFHKVIESLENIATKKFDAQFNYNAGIREIIVDSENKAKGVRLEDGTEEFADIVICNADLVYAYNKLLPETSYGKKLGTKGVLTSSSISFYWSMSRKMHEFGVHNIFLSEAYKSSFDQIFKEHLLPEDPSFYIHVPSQMDETAAPAGKESMVVLVPVGHIVDANKDRFDELVKKARAQVIGLIEERFKIKNFASLIEDEMVNDPRTWREKFNLWKGSILGLSHNIPQVLYFRPSTRSHLFKNLYFVGASSQCGTGVPVVLCSAKLLERQILEDLGIVEKKTDDFKIMMEFALFGLFIALLMLYFFVL